jgi:hypothetical protein
MNGMTEPDFWPNAPLRTELISCYEEIMWLAGRSGVTPPNARTWYTHVRAETFKRQLRRFTGSVSANAAGDPEQLLVLEHFEGIQRRLSTLVANHKERGIKNPDEFVRLLVDYERVHIVTRLENYAAAKSRGDYATAGIHLISWDTISEEVRAILWRKMLRNRVANANMFLGKRVGTGTSS